MARGSDKKYRVIWTNLKNSFQFHYAFGHFLLKKLSKVRAQKCQKIVVPAPLASNAAGSSVAVSNDNDMGYLYLPGPEISDADNLS